MEVQIVNKIARYLCVPVGIINIDEDNRVTRSIKNTEDKGLATIIIKLLEETNDSNINYEQLPQIYQWLEYVSIHASSLKLYDQSSKTLLKDLNKYLENYSYLVGYSKTLADIIVYYALYELIASLSPAEQESYINLCRWFDHIQYFDDVRKDDKLINFSANYSVGRTKISA